ncbi:MAG TPA: hypothetical protein ENJ28_08305 [Gammaproteobacteria bacterium]|nr:hypothetical protein [Gammaproteobacteria bacterium]
MSVSNRFMVVDWAVFSTEYEKHGESSFLLELIHELDDYPNSETIKNDWFEYLQLDSVIENAAYTGMMYEQVEEAKNSVSTEQYQLLCDVVGILNVDLTDPYNDINKNESEVWLYSSYKPNAVSDSYSKIVALSSVVGALELKQELKDSFTNYTKDLKEVFSKAVNSNNGILIAIG